MFLFFQLFKLTCFYLESVINLLHHIQNVPVFREEKSVKTLHMKVKKLFLDFPYFLFQQLNTNSTAHQVELLDKTLTDGRAAP